MPRKRTLTRQAGLRSAKTRRLATNSVDPDPVVQTIDMQFPENYLGEMSMICEFCGATHFKCENSPDGRFSLCCQKGKVILEPLKECPDLLYQLYTRQHPESSNFHQFIRTYNSTLAFASMGANISPPTSGGPYFFKLHGQVYHRTGTLHPADGEKRKFAQLYIFDSEEASSYRMSLIPQNTCSATLMNLIGDVIHNLNPYAKAFRMLYEVQRQMQANGTELGQLQMLLKQDRQSDPRRYNNPTSNEVAVVFQNVDGNPPFERDLVIHLRPNSNDVSRSTVKEINILDCNLDPMLYPLLFIHGERGWNQNICQHGTSRRVTMRQYYCHRISTRDIFSPIIHAGKLFHQFIVDAYVKIEGNNLNYIRQNQSNLRTELYQGLMDHINSDSDQVPGTRIILPSSFNGSPRNMQQKYRDAMSIVQKFGKPDFFITMTCNPKWREIQEGLKTWDRAEHRPDLISRVFNQKLKCLLDDILKKDLFGKVIGYVYVIEFQKRGLPHAHILVIVDEESKPDTPEKIDAVVTAEVPDKELNPRLFQIVTTNMIHSPCGTGTNLPCMEKDVCKKRYPKPYQETTVNNRDGYPLYMRRMDQKFDYKGKMIGNEWVVPYNSILALKYNCHINVEVCASFKSVKYLFKYVYKGHDCAKLVLSETRPNHDEIHTYLDARYVSAPEASWRIFSFKMHDQSHSVNRLAVHLPDQQIVVFRPETVQADLARAAGRNTTLTAWFLLNAADDDARKYLYAEIPYHYRFERGRWQARVRNFQNIIGRIYSVSPLDTERYYLRLLLLHIRGATSYEDLRTVNGALFPSFKGAASAMGLLDDDNVWRATLSDATIVQTPKCLRQLFGLILVLSEPGHPMQLWLEFKEHFVEDFCHTLGHYYGDCSICDDLALNDIEETLQAHGKSCSYFGLPVPNKDVRLNNEDNLIEDQQLAESLKSTLNFEQRVAYETIMSAISNEPGSKCYFLDGPGGSGKTYVYQTLSAELRGKSCVVLSAASTGIAANLMKGGRTVHSLYKVSIPVNETSVSRIRPNSQDAEILRAASLLIIDEATMLLNHLLNVVDNLLQELMNNAYPFGGKVMLLGGDFRQCLPVVPHAQEAAIVQSSIKYSRHWHNFKILTLSRNERSRDPDYSSWLLQLGDGKLTNQNSLGDDVVHVPAKYLSDNLIEDIFGNELIPENITQFSKRTILSPKNDEVDKINDQILNILVGQDRTYFSYDKVECDDKDEMENFPIEFVNSLTPSGMPPHKLRLKIGAVAILLRNLNTPRGLCNGTRVCIKNMFQNVLQALVLTGSAEGTTVLIPRISLCPSSQDLPFKMTRRQFPIKLAFAMTINKSQGQTMDRVGILLREPVFSHGQLYVAFSRVRSSNDVKIQIYDGPQQGKLLEGSEIFTKNVVFQEIFN